jgi:hypothetical protein
VGRCNRESKCGYHYKPGEFFRENPEWKAGDSWKESEAWKTAVKPREAPKPQPVEYLPQEALTASQKHFERNNFFRYLSKLHGQQKAHELAELYQLGTSKLWEKEAKGLAVIFWQIDKAGNIRQSKAMAYNAETGRRLKAEGKSFVSFLGKKILKNDKANLQQCFFGEHLLPQFPEKPLCLVESEKTAVIMAGYHSEAIWLATGGKNGCKWTEEEVYQALEGRNLTLYPDLGAFEEWQEKGKLLAIPCQQVRTSDLLEKKATDEEREAGLDIADFYSPQEAPEDSQGETGSAPAPEKETLIEGQEEARKSHEQPQAEQEAQKPKESPSEAPEIPLEEEMPSCFTFYPIPRKAPLQGMEYKGLPWEWLNSEEESEAREKLAGFELEAFKQMNPEIKKLVEVFGLEPDLEALNN